MRLDDLDWMSQEEGVRRHPEEENFPQRTGRRLGETQIQLPQTTGRRTALQSIGTTSPRQRPFGVLTRPLAVETPPAGRRTRSPALRPQTPRFSPSNFRPRTQIPVDEVNDAENAQPVRLDFSAIDCPICMNGLNNAVVFDCGHGACAKCAFNMFLDQYDRPEFKCPYRDVVTFTIKDFNVRKMQRGKVSDYYQYALIDDMRVNIDDALQRVMNHDLRIRHHPFEDAVVENPAGRINFETDSPVAVRLLDEGNYVTPQPGDRVRRHQHGLRRDAFGNFIPPGQRGSGNSFGIYEDE